jgi:flagellar biosynthetic protein FliP
MTPAIVTSLAPLAGGLAVVLGLVFIAARLVSGLQLKMPQSRKRTPMQVLQKISLGPKQGLALLRIGDQVYAVGLGEGVQLSPLAMSDAERRALIGDDAVAMPVNLSAVMAPTPMMAAAMPAPVMAASAMPAPMAAMPSATRSTVTMPAPTPTLVPRPMAASVKAPLPSAPMMAPVRKELRDVLRTAMRTATTLGILGFVAVSHRAEAQAATATKAPTPANASAAAAPSAQTQAPKLLTPQLPVAPAVPTKPGLPIAPTTPPRPGSGLATTPGAAANATSATPATNTAPAAAASLQAPAAAPLSAMKTTEQLVAKLSPQMDVRMGGSGEGLRMSGTVGVVIMMGLLTLLPTLLLMMTGFTRILIVLQFLRQALGTQSAPPGQLVAALALLLTGFVMAPTLQEANTIAIQPWLAGQMEQPEMMATAVKPFRAFMLRQTRDKDIETFIELSDTKEAKTPDDIPLVVLASAFATSELRIAFQMGFAIFLPFIIVDMVVSSVLMSMGMAMLPPAMIALPFKLLLFVLVDGWTLVVQSLVHSFH